MIARTALLTALISGGCAAQATCDEPVAAGPSDAERQRAERIDALQAQVAELTAKNGELVKENEELSSQLASVRQPRPVASRPSVDPALAERYAALIEKTGEGAYTFRGGARDLDVDQVVQQARIVPSFKNGAPNGFKLFSIRAGSFYERLGLENGDVVHSVNGMPLTSPDEAVEAYKKIRGAKTIEVVLTRRGEPVTLTWSLGPK